MGKNSSQDDGLPASTTFELQPRPVQPKPPPSFAA